MGAYALIGESRVNEQASKYIQLACFFSSSTLRLRLFDRTSDGCERCLNEESALDHSLCDSTREILIRDNDDALCINCPLHHASTLVTRRSPFVHVGTNVWIVRVLFLPFLICRRGMTIVACSACTITSLYISMCIRQRCWTMPCTHVLLSIGIE
jgi:hypothetical protein